MKKLNVVSLCDGLSVGQIALRAAGIEYGYYVAYEIDKYAMKVTHNNFPATIQMGDIRGCKISKFPFTVDLVLSGTPCTDFSGAGKLAEFGGANGQLFFEFCRVLKEAKEYNPNVKFLFENVASMRRHVRDVITTMLGVEPILINSSKVCAQNRNRLYWTNIEGIEQPEDRGIILQDILEDDVNEKYYLSEKVLARINKDAVIKQLAILNEHRLRSAYILAECNSSQDGKVFAISGKSQCLSAGHGNVPKVAYGGAVRGRYNDDGSTSQRIELNRSSKSNALTTVEKDNIVVVTHNMMPRSSKSGKGGTGQVTRTDGKSYCLDTGQTNAIQIVQLNPDKQFGNPPRTQNRVYDSADKSPTLTNTKGHTINVAIGAVCTNGTLREVYNNKGMCQDANYYKGMDNHAARTVVASVADCNTKGKLKRNQDKAACFTAGAHSGGNHSDMDVLVQMVEDNLIIRRLTPIEVCRLQGIPDNYFFKDGKQLVSDTQVYKAVGNAWQKDTIVHILSYYKK